MTLLPIVRRSLAVASLAIAFAATDARAQDTKIDVSLFDRQVTQNLPGKCQLRLWQSNRDPDKDRFAVIFYETMDSNHNRQPARMEIGGKVLQFQRVAIGGETPGLKLHARQLYKSTTEDYYAIIEVKATLEPGEVVEVENGTITLVKTGKLPFVARVKGAGGCV